MQREYTRMERENKEETISQVVNKYVDLMSHIHDKYHELNNKYEIIHKKAIKACDERDHYKEKYEELCKSVIEKSLKL